MIFLLRLMLLALFAQGTASQPAQSSASIEGIVVRSGNGGPIAGVNVELRKSQTASVQAPTITRDIVVSSDSMVFTTSSDGRFQFRNVSPGEYRLYATRSNGYVPGEYGQRTPTGAGSPFTIANGQPMTGITLTMTPTASISGRVMEGDGEPAGYAFVQALKAVYRDGRRSLTIMQMVQADDRGDYRLYWLPPGEYFVGVRPVNLRRSSEMLHIPPPSRFGNYEQQDRPITTALVTSRTLDNGEIAEEMYSAVYYPGTLEEQRALPITLRGGDSVNGVDINVAGSLVRTHHIRGTVINGATGLPVSASLQVLPRTPPAILKIHSGSSDNNGAFDLAGAPPGPDYLIANGSGLSGLLAIDVGADVNQVIFKVWPLVSIPVRLTIEGRGLIQNGADMAGLAITLRRNPAVNGLPEPRSAGTIIARTAEGATITVLAPKTSNSDGAFTLSNVGPGDYTVMLNPKPDLYVKSIWFGTQDVLNAGLHVEGVIQDELQIVLGANAGSLDVRVTDESGDPAMNATVALAPDANRRGRLDLYKSGAADSSGRIHLQGIAPGDYRVFAWEDVESGAWQNPEFIRVVEGRGRPIHIDEGTKATVDVNQIPAQR